MQYVIKFKTHKNQELTSVPYPSEDKARLAAMITAIAGAPAGLHDVHVDPIDFTPAEIINAK